MLKNFSHSKKGRLFYMLISALLGLSWFPGINLNVTHAATVVPVPATPGIGASTIYSVNVEGQPVFVGSETSAGTTFQTAKFCMSGTVRVDVTVSSSFSTAIIKPQNYGLTYTKNGNTITFYLSEPKNIEIYISGLSQLMLFATPLETEIPNPSDPKVHYYGPGTHNIGRLKLGSDETVYIAGGARVVGTLEAYEAKNIKILGRGTLDGSVDTNWTNRIFGIYFDRCENVTIEGISVRNCYWWVTEFLLTKNVNINYMNIFSFNQNNGGIMADGCNYFTVQNCFLLTMDDCICPHALNAAGNGEPVGNNFLFENCVLYNVSTGNGIRIGASFETKEVLNWTFRNIYVLKHSGAAIYSDHSDWANVKNLRFINFYDEQGGSVVNMFIKKTSYSCATGYKDERGNYTGLYFVNLVAPSGTITLNGYDATHKFKDVYFYNCKIGTNNIDSLSDLTVNSYVENVNFITNGSTPAPATVTPEPTPVAQNVSEKIIDDGDASGYKACGFTLGSSSDSYNGDLNVATVPTGFSNFKAAIYEPNITGTYDVYTYWGAFTSKATNSPWIVYHTGGYTTQYLNQNNTSGWHYLGRFTFDALSYVRLALPGYYVVANNPVVADAVMFELAGGATPTPTPTPTSTGTVTASPTPTPTATPTATPGGNLFSDDFEDGNSIGWTNVNGTWSVVTDGTKVYKQTSTSGEALTYAGNSTWTNYTVESRVKLYTTASNAGSGIIGRYTDSNNYYLLRLHSGLNKVQLYKKVGGTFSLLNEVVMTINTNQWYTLRLVLSGSSLTGYVDGVQKVSATDSSLTGGCIGVRGYSQSCAVDDVVVL